MKNVGKFDGHLVYFTAIWFILLPFCIFYGHLPSVYCGHFGIFLPFWYLAPRKIWQLRWKIKILNWSERLLRRTAE
jgi:hypothetical protein